MLKIQMLCKMSQLRVLTREFVRVKALFFSCFYTHKPTCQLSLVLLSQFSSKIAISEVKGVSR